MFFRFYKREKIFFFLSLMLSGVGMLEFTSLDRLMSMMWPTHIKYSFSVADIVSARCEPGGGHECVHMSTANLTFYWTRQHQYPLCTFTTVCSRISCGCGDSQLVKNWFYRTLCFPPPTECWLLAPLLLSIINDRRLQLLNDRQLLTPDTPGGDLNSTECTFLVIYSVGSFEPSPWI